MFILENIIFLKELTKQTEPHRTRRTNAVGLNIKRHYSEIVSQNMFV